MNAEAVYWFVIALAAIPIPLLLYAWYRRFLNVAPADERVRLILFVVATVSHFWIISGMKYPMAIGNYYTNLRYGIIDFNCVVMLACSVLVLLSKGHGRTPLAIASILITALWLITAAVNVVV